MTCKILQIKLDCKKQRIRKGCILVKIKAKLNIHRDSMTIQYQQ